MPTNSLKTKIFEIICAIIMHNHHAQSSFLQKDNLGLSVCADLGNILLEINFRELSINTENTELYL